MAPASPDRDVEVAGQSEDLPDDVIGGNFHGGNPSWREWSTFAREGRQTPAGVSLPLEERASSSPDRQEVPHGQRDRLLGKGRAPALDWLHHRLATERSFWDQTARSRVPFPRGRPPVVEW